MYFRQQLFPEMIDFKLGWYKTHALSKNVLVGGFWVWGIDLRLVPSCKIARKCPKTRLKKHVKNVGAKFIDTIFHRKKL